MPLGSGIYSQDSNTGSCHSTGVVETTVVPAVSTQELDPSPEKPLGSARLEIDIAYYIGHSVRMTK